VQHAGPARAERGGVTTGCDARTGGLDAVDRYFAVVQERMEQADGVGAAADAGDQRIRQQP